LAKLWEKILLYLGLAEEEMEYPETMKEDEELIQQEPAPRRGKVVNLHTSKNQRVIIMKPEDFGEAKTIADHMRHRRTVVLNLERAGLEEAKRVLDFVSGTAYALNCNVVKVSDNIFIFSPDNIELTAEFKKDIVEKGAYYQEDQP
jgi:cell division inhibitor SepF